MKKIKKVSGADYHWEQISGLNDMLDWLKTRQKTNQVEVTNVEKAAYHYKNHPLWHHYGDTMTYVDEAYEFNDGSVLLCGSVSSWGGTFASHDDIQVKYYTLTPK